MRRNFGFDQLRARPCDDVIRVRDTHRIQQTGLNHRPFGRGCSLGWDLFALPAQKQKHSPSDLGFETRGCDAQ
jgi:hypothetical protein